MWRLILTYGSDTPFEMDYNTNEAPEGFLDLVYNFERDDFNNLVSEYTEKLGFTKEARTWIKSKIASDGYDISILCQIQQRGSNYIYSTIIEGILNIEDYEEDRYFIYLNISESSFQTKLTGRANTEIEYNSKYTIDQSELPGFINNFIEIELEGITGTTTVKGIYLYEAVVKVLQKMLDVEYNPLKSSILGRTDLTDNGFSDNYAVDGFLGRIIITKGLFISGIEPNGILTKEEGKSDLIIKFTELFETINTIFPIGMDIEEIDGVKHVVIEDLSYFFQNDQYTFEIERDRVKDVHSRLIQRFFNNNVKFGFNVVSKDNDFGLGDFTGVVEYSAPLNNFKNTYEYIGRYSISPSDIELARQNPVSGRADDKAFQTDETIFLIDCYEDSGVIYSRDKSEGFQSDVSGAYGTNKLYTNARIRPTQNIYNHGKFIKIGLQYNETDSLIFQKSENLSKIQSQLADSAIIVTDLENITISDLDSENGEVFLSGIEKDISTYLTAEEFAELRTYKKRFLKYWDTTNNEYNYMYVRKIETNADNGGNTKITGWQPISITELAGGSFLQLNGSSFLQLNGDKFLQIA